MTLPAPKKLKNPFAALEQQQQSAAQTAKPQAGKKGLTWSERQALAKERNVEEAERSRAAGKTFQDAPPLTNRKWGVVTAGTAVGTALQGDKGEEQVSVSASHFL